MRVLLALVALTQCGEPLAQEYAAVTKQQTHADKPTLKIFSKKLDFVNKMREDLRRNNDDYALLEGQNQLEYSSLRAHPAPRQPNRKRMPPAHGLPPSERAGLPLQNYDTRRGKDDANEDVVIQGHLKQGAVNQDIVNQGHVNQGHVNQGHVSQGHVNQAAMNQGEVNQGHVNQGAVNQEAMIQGDVNQISQSATYFRSFSHARHLKSLRVSNLTKMLNGDKNKLRMRGTEPKEPDMKSFTLPTTIPTSPPTPAPPPPPPPLPPRRMHTPLPPVPLRDVHLREELARQRSPARRLNRNPPPLPDQIDMAHALNPIITRIRLKGRLCQRSLMNVEGPMYDRDGKEVMPEHDPRHAHGRLFRQTRAPELVLPKCCNCCKKSVLGCQ